MTTEQIDHQWLVADLSTLVAGRIVNGSKIYYPAYSLTKALEVQQQYPFSVIIEIRWRREGQRVYVLYQGVVQP